MLGRDGTVTGNRVAPVRSSSAVLVSSQNQNREWNLFTTADSFSRGFSGQLSYSCAAHGARHRDQDMHRLSRREE